MTNIKIYFTKKVKIATGTNSEISNLINKAVYDAKESREYSEDYAVKAKSLIDMEEINRIVLSENSKNGIEFIEIKTDLTIESHAQSIEDMRTNTLNYTWSVNSEIESRIYEVLSFQPDKMIVCTKENENEILFLDISKISNLKVFKI